MKVKINNMTTNWQFTSLKTSKRLKELGVEGESMMYWIEQSDGCVVNRSLAMYEENGCDLKILWGKFTPYQDYKKYSAFSPSELGEILPDRIKSEFPNSWIVGKDERYFCSYETADHSLHDEFAETMVESMGLMAIFLKENKLI